MRKEDCGSFIPSGCHQAQFAQRNNSMKRLCTLLILLVLIGMPLNGVSGQGASDTVVIRGLGNISTFNPVLASDGASLQAYSILFPQAIGTDPDSGKAVPGLTSWTVSDDGLTYTFTIQKDA